MMEFLNFTFRNLWTFCGVVLLIVMSGYSIQIALSGLRGFIHIGNQVTENYEEIPSEDNEESGHDLDN